MKKMVLLMFALVLLSSMGALAVESVQLRSCSRHTDCQVATCTSSSKRESSGNQHHGRSWQKGHGQHRGGCRTTAK